MHCKQNLLRCSVASLLGIAVSGCGIPVRVNYYDSALESKWEGEFSKRPLDPIEGFWLQHTEFGEGVGVTHRIDPSFNSGFPFAMRVVRADYRVPLMYAKKPDASVAVRVKPTDNPRVYTGECILQRAGRSFWVPITVTLLDLTTREIVVHSVEPVIGGTYYKSNLVAPKKELDARLAAMTAKRRENAAPGSTTTQPVLVSGSGFLISPTLVITNQHVVSGSDDIRCFIASRAIAARVIAHDDGNDLALLRLESAAPPQIPILRVGDSSQVRLGQHVVALGFPLTDVLGKDVRLHTGVISSLSGFQGTSGQFQIEASFNPGDSGGPVLDDSGAVVGVVISKLGLVHLLRTGNIPEGIAFAIKAEFIRSIATSAGVANELRADHAPASAPERLEDMVRALRDGVVRIEVGH